MRLNSWLVTGATALVALTLACGRSDAPTSPSAAAQAGNGLGPGGATLKIDAPTLASPTNGVELQSTPVLVVNNVRGSFDTFPVTYEVELRNPAGNLVSNPRFASSTGQTTSYTVTTSLEFDTVYSWRARATYNGGVGPWSSTQTFKTSLRGYIRESPVGSEVFDPMINGDTVGLKIGPVTCAQGEGCTLHDPTAHIQYDLPATLEAGEFSLMEMGADEGNNGGKSKVMSMQEGHDDITDNDYRMTAELRGRNAGDPGAVSCRIITGDASDEGRIFDCSPRIVINPSSSKWYFWKFTWSTGSAELTVREDGPDGPLIYSRGLGTGSHPYRPTPHVAYIGSPIGRNGPEDATSAPMTVKNVWLSAAPRPLFPNALGKLLKGGR